MYSKRAKITSSCFSFDQNSNSLQVVSKKSNYFSEWREVKSSLSQGWSHLLETGLYTDMSFKVGQDEHIFNAHKVLLMMRSEVFEVMLNDRWTDLMELGENGESRIVINIPNKNPTTFRIFLHYLYTDNFPRETTVLESLEVLDLAHMYRIPQLLAYLSSELISKLSVQDCGTIYEATKLYSDLNIRLCAWIFMNRYAGMLAESGQFLLLKEETLTALMKSNHLEIEEIKLFNALLRWGQYKENVTESDEDTDFDKDADVDEENSEINSDAVEEENVIKTEIVDNAEEGEVFENADVADASLCRQKAIKSLISHVRFLLMNAQDFAKEVVPSKVLSDDEAFKLLTEINLKDTDSKYSCNRLKAMSTPRYPAYAQFKCFPNDASCYSGSQCVYQYFSNSPTNTPESEIKLVPQFKFKTNQPITICVIKFYGIRGMGTYENEICYTVNFNITSIEEASACTNETDTDFLVHQKTIRTTEIETVDAILDLSTSIKILPNRWYLISASISANYKDSEITHLLRHGSSNDMKNEVDCSYNDGNNVVFEIDREGTCEKVCCERYQCTQRNHRCNSYDSRPRGREQRRRHSSASPSSCFIGIVHSFVYSRIDFGSL